MRSSGLFKKNVFELRFLVLLRGVERLGHGGVSRSQDKGSFKGSYKA